VFDLLLLPQPDPHFSTLSPDEHPFTPISKLPQPMIAIQEYPPLLHPQSTSHPSTNVNDRILKFYVDTIVPAITKRVVLKKKDADADDGNYGSSATRDVEVLQALSRRIHFGMWERGAGLIGV
jgi:chorismate mutase